ncbi:MAG TPA: hypothetical protein VFG54_09780 [Prolixibacteraceae bacterium]|nr:hypothetical protein [Prolixibacteraceae bacterium]
MALEKLILLSVFYLGILANPKIGAQNITPSETKIHSERSLFSSLHTLSIHIKDPAVHDSVFLFLKEQLQLPVYYHPLTLGERKYAGIYAGNLVLEPCGPYSNFQYATPHFKALFFGLTFEPFHSISLIPESLQKKQIKHEVAGDEFIYLKDNGLCGQNITISIMERHEKLRDHARRDSLRLAIALNSHQGMGIEYVKEVRIGYSQDLQLQKWKAFTSPSSITSENLWNVGNGLTIRFVPTTIKEVKGIVFKVKSLARTKQYLAGKQFTFMEKGKEIILDPAQAFGLSICFSE